MGRGQLRSARPVLTLGNVIIKSRRRVREIDVVRVTEASQNVFPDFRFRRATCSRLADVTDGQYHTRFGNRCPDDGREVLKVYHKPARRLGDFCLCLVGRDSRVFLHHRGEDFLCLLPVALERDDYR